MAAHHGRVVLGWNTATSMFRSSLFGEYYLALYMMTNIMQIFWVEKLGVSRAEVAGGGVWCEIEGSVAVDALSYREILSGRRWREPAQ